MVSMWHSVMCYEIAIKWRGIIFNYWPWCVLHCDQLFHCSVAVVAILWLFSPTVFVLHVAWRLLRDLQCSPHCCSFRACDWWRIVQWHWLLMTWNHWCNYDMLCVIRNNNIHGIDDIGIILVAIFNVKRLLAVLIFDIRGRHSSVGTVDDSIWCSDIDDDVFTLVMMEALPVFNVGIVVVYLIDYYLWRVIAHSLARIKLFSIVLSVWTLYIHFHLLFSPFIHFNLFVSISHSTYRR